jgi:enamine deaminase RidA (YjgF/YER057c/UK114 family)
MSDRKLVSSGSYLEPIIGFSRAVRVGNIVSVGGTAPIAAGGGTAAPGDAYGQTRRCLEIIGQALEAAGASFAAVTRTRILLTNIAHWQDAARAHAEIFGIIRPVTTLMQVSAFVDPAWLVEIEADAVL